MPSGDVVQCCSACGFCSILDKGTNVAKEYVSFHSNIYIQKPKGPGSERNITMATHLEVTQKQWDTCCNDALLKRWNNMRDLKH